MADKSWKAFERKICRMFGGDRRGADYADERGGKNDCIDTPGWSIEIKYLGAPTWGVLVENAQNAVARKKLSTDIGIGIVKRKSSVGDENILVCMTLPEFRDFFVNVAKEEECAIAHNGTCLGTTKEKCFACGLPACQNCTVNMEWFHFGLQRVCKTCIGEHYGKH